ncbi:MAG: UDP-N-acetylmuramyl-tripeptide synthetase [Candidatus Jorgensenbacteria bacterium]|nr:UDP-N-acetylmuramyl-tripeptide synthetase [Candidatus Jorgensenbacteria bacterium]
MNILFSIYHWCWAFFGNILYGFPSRKLFVIGVTGTKGKSTTLELMNAVLEASEKKTALLSTVRRKVGEKSVRNSAGNTMPGRFAIQKFLRDAVNAHCTHALIEVSSQGVLQHRHQFIAWDVAAFLNIAPEHIEAHGSFQEYRGAKLEFFRSVLNSPKLRKYFIINTEDCNYAYFLDIVKDKEGSDVIYFSKNKFLSEKLKGKKELLGNWLSADFNIENASAAFALAQILKIEWPTVEHALAAFNGVPGRLDIIQREPFAVVVDYAHTPDSLLAVYDALRKDYKTPSGRMICILGCAGGGRDKWKRPEMGKIASEKCDTIILTNEDPYDENPTEIISQIRSGISPDFLKSSVCEIIDRIEAIRKALSLAHAGDVVIATGKGSESSIHIANGETVPWNERGVFEEELKKLRPLN